MDSLHPYMDPLHPLVCNIFNKFAGCPCCPRRFHNLYNNPCCSTNPWHPLWPSTLNQLQRGVVTSTQHFRGSTISHWKYLFNISNGYFVESHLASWFERYHRLNLNMYLTQGGRAYHHIQWYFSPCSGNYRRISTYGWKYLFNISNGYFSESHLASWFERYHRLNLSMYLTQGGRAYHHIQRYFSPCSENYRRSSTYGWKYLFNISNGYFTEFHFVVWFMRYLCLKQHMSVTSVVTRALQIRPGFSHSMGHLRTSSIYRWKYLFSSSNGSSTELDFITCSRSYEYICRRMFTAPKVTIFPYYFLNFGILLKFIYFSTHVQCHCQLGYGSTTNPWLWVNHTKPFSSLGIFTL
jgi:hypothetical protein